MSEKAQVTDGVRIDGIVSQAPTGFGQRDGSVVARVASTTIISEGATYGVVVTDWSIPAALSLHVGQHVTCYGTLLAWPGKDRDELWGEIMPYAKHEQEAA